MSLRGFKSIRELTDFDLHPLNVIIGANGAGKSNLIQVFKMLKAMELGRFQAYILTHGGADGFLYNGPKITQSIAGEFHFYSVGAAHENTNSYRFELTPTVDERFLVEEWRKYVTSNWRSYGSPSLESRLVDQKDEKSVSGEFNGIGFFVHGSIANWVVYHFHDTSAASAMRRSSLREDNERLRPEGGNIAALLLALREDAKTQVHYQQIVHAVRAVLPFFDDFRLDIAQQGSAQQVRLSWTQKGSDFPMQPYHLSDGSIRFICLATALLQPNPPSLLVIDEPELGLHPEAIRVFGELVRAASRRMQIVLATQSPLLLDQFEIDDIIVTMRRDHQTTFERLKEEDFSVWLEDYSIGELWMKNVIQGGAGHE